MGYISEEVKVSDLHFAFLANWTLALDYIGAGTEDVLTDKNVVSCMREEEELADLEEPGKHVHTQNDKQMTNN